MAQQSSQYDYSHGASPSKPASALDFQTGDAAPPNAFDWWWYTTIQKIDALVTDIENILNGSETVGDADTVDGQDFADIQAWVNDNADVPNADLADQAQSFEARANYPTSPSPGRVVFRTDKT